MQSEVPSHFSDVGTSPEDDRERDAVADCTVVGGVHCAAEAGILSEVDVSHPMVAVFDRPMTAVPSAIPDIFFLLFIIMKLFLFFKYLFRAIFSPKICLPSGKTISSGKNDAEFVPQTSIDAGNA